MTDRRSQSPVCPKCRQAPARTVNIANSPKPTYICDHCEVGWQEPNRPAPEPPPEARFPILGGVQHQSIPWSVIEPHAEQARRNHDQSLARLAEGGGLSGSEIVAVLEDRPWHSMPAPEAFGRLDELVAAAQSATEGEMPRRYLFPPTQVRAQNARARAATEGGAANAAVLSSIAAEALLEKWEDERAGSEWAPGLAKAARDLRDALEVRLANAAVLGILKEMGVEEHDVPHMVRCVECKAATTWWPDIVHRQGCSRTPCNGKTRLGGSEGEPT